MSSKSLPARLLADKERAAGTPIYKQIRAYILEHIASGQWKPGEKIPSETELCDRFGTSRMTVNKALRELTHEGRVKRITGLGTFVRAPTDEVSRTGLVTLRSIAEEIRSRGHHHSANVVLLRLERVAQSVTDAMGIPVGTDLFHSIIVHRDNDVPIQVEERYVLPEVAPAYLSQDYSRITTFDYLHSVATVTEVEHVISAVRPVAEALLLQMPADEPCLHIRRRTWWSDRVTTLSNLVHPGNRFEVSGRFPYFLSPRSERASDRLYDPDVGYRL